MDIVLRRTLEVLAGSAVIPIHTASGLPDPTACGSSAICLLSSSREVTKMLRARGYAHIHSFIVIPSNTSPRWLLPTGGAQRMLAGTRIYHPHKWVPRVLKQVAVGMMRMGWQGCGTSKILVASKDRLPLVDLVSAVIGENNPQFALSLGRQAAVRKLTIQVMRSNGDILGYMKLPLTFVATERVRNEAKMLERLWSSPALRRHIPRLLYFGSCGDTQVLFQSALEGEPGPLRLTDLHTQMLRALWNVHSIEKSGQLVIGELANKWKQAAPLLGSEWESLGREVLRQSTHHLQGRMLRCGVMHGDFAPWNTLVRKSNLLLFDWESAEWEAPTLWDMFHFQVQTSYFLHKNTDFKPFHRHQPSDEISFMLYALSAVCQFLEEENHTAIHHLKPLLVKQLQQRQLRPDVPVCAG